MTFAQPIPAVSAAVGALFVFSERDVTGVIQLECDERDSSKHRIVVLKHNHLLEGFASAFLLRYNNTWFIATCKHCVVNDDSPRSCCIVFPRYGTVNLNIHTDDGKIAFLHFPADDVVLFPFSVTDFRRFGTDTPHPVELFRPEPSPISLNDDMNLLGFMRLSWDKSPSGEIAYRSMFFALTQEHGPILKAGSVAHPVVHDTTYDKGNDRDRDEHYFLIDATGRGGMSGCPVFKGSGSCFTLVGIYRGREENDILSRLRNTERSVQAAHFDIARLHKDVQWILDKDRTSEIGKVIPVSRVVELINTQKLRSPTSSASSSATAASSIEPSAPALAASSSPPRPASSSSLKPAAAAAVGTAAADDFDRRNAWDDRA